MSQQSPSTSADASTRPARTSSGSGGAIVIILAVLGGLFVVSVCAIGILMVLLSLAINAAKEASGRAQSMNNALQIGNALQAYASEKGQFPPQYTVDKGGRRLHSWRTLLLPYLGREDLYAQIDLEKPWDHPDNAATVAASVALFRSPRHPNEGNFTNYVAVAGDGALFNGEKRTKPFAHLIAFLEIANSDIPWAEPRDLTFETLQLDSDGAAPETVNIVRTMAVVSYVDGHVEVLDASESKDSLRRSLFEHF